MNNAVKATITGIKFVNPQWAAINIAHSSGITIANNEIAGVLPFMNNNGYTESSGIYLYGAYGWITGAVSITGNYIHGLDGQYEFGVKTYAITPVTTITGNTVQVGYATDSTAGDVDAEAISIDGCPGTTNITGNNVQIGQGVGHDGIAIWGPQTGAANIVGNEVSVPEGAVCYESIGVNGTTGAVQILANSIDARARLRKGSPCRATPIAARFPTWPLA